MSDIQVPATQQLTQALNQLNKFAPQSEAARLGIDVIVKHLAGSMLNLSTSASGQNRGLSLPSRNLQGQLQNAATYTVKVVAQENPVLQFFSSASPAEQITIPLTPQQLQSLLKLPANQILNLTSTPVQGSPNQGRGDVPLLLNAKVESLLNNQLLVKVKGQNKLLPIQLPIGIASQFKAKDSLQIELSPNGAKWQAKVTSVPTASAKPGQSVSNKGPQEPLLLSKQSDKALQGSALKPAVPLLKTHKVVIPSEQAPALLKAALLIANKSKPPSVQLPVQTILSQLPNKQSENVASLSNKLSQLSGESVTLSATSAGHFELRGSRAKAVAQLPVSRDVLSALTQVKIPQKNPQTTTDAAKIAIQSQNPVSANVALTAPKHKAVENPKSAVNPNALSASATPTAGSADNRLNAIKIPPDTVLNKAAAGAPQNAVLPQKTLNTPVSSEKPQYSARLPLAEKAENTASKGLVESKTETLPPTSERGAIVPPKAEQIKLIQTLLRVVNARAELPAETLSRIQLAVTDPLVSKEASLKELIDPLVQQIKQSIPQGKDNDAMQIRQLLSAPALNLSAVQLLAPPASQGLLGGLVAILQISLASRLLRNQPTQLDNITQTLSSLIAGTNKAPSSAQAARGLADFFQVEQKHQLLKEIGRLLSGHQANKLTSAEQVIQGQDAFYYTLPSAFDDKLKDIELLIRRESESSQEQSQNKTEAKSWHLTMKLSVGELGELLTKAKLRPDHLEIDFYASNEATKEQVFNFLPLLKRRLESLGIEVAKSQCQLGKIPSTLQQRPYQVFQTKV